MKHNWTFGIFSLCYFCFSFSVLFSDSNTHSHSDQQQPIAWFIPQRVHSLTLPRLRQPRLYNLQKTSLILITHTHKKKKTQHFRGGNFWAIYSHSVALNSLTDLGEHALSDKRRRTAGSGFVWTHFNLACSLFLKWMLMISGKQFQRYILTKLHC